jgi:hypothetical protein
MNTAKVAVAAPSAPADAVTELRRFLELGAAQLDAALRESDVRVETLTGAVSAVASDARALEQSVQALGAADAASRTAARRRISELTQALTAHVQAAITAMQFYDKLVQRLTHVRDGLAIPSDYAANPDPARTNWDALLERVRARYSTVEERVLFDFMIRGLNAEQMLKALTGMRAAAVSGEFEAF